MQDLPAPNTVLAATRDAAADFREPNATVLSNQVRVSGGYTHAPGLINPDTGRQMWGRMCGKLGTPRTGFRRFADVDAAAEANDKQAGAPKGLAGTTAWRIYEYLLTCAADSSESPSNTCIGDVFGIANNQVTRKIATLQRHGVILVAWAPGRGRSIQIVETGQVLRPRYVQKEAA